jgi:hypothetical protein
MSREDMSMQFMFPPVATVQFRAKPFEASRMSINSIDTHNRVSLMKG